MQAFQAREILKQPLVFGNPEQILAVRTLEKEEEKKTFQVEIEVSGRYSVEVSAEDEAEAGEIAMEHFDPYDSDIDFDVIHCEQIDDKAQ
jgi:hypothetical protein